MNNIYEGIKDTIEELMHVKTEIKEYEDGKVEIDLLNTKSISSLIIEDNNAIFYDVLVEYIQYNSKPIYSYELNDKDGLNYIIEEIKEILIDEDQGLDYYRNQEELESSNEFREM